MSSARYRDSPARNSGQRLRVSQSSKNELALQPEGRSAVGAIGDVDDVAVVVDAGFDEQVRT